MSRIAFLSTAHVHSPNFLKQVSEKSSQGTPYAIWDDNVERGKAFAEQFKCRFVNSIDALIQDPTVDGFLICNENNGHTGLLQKVLPTGKPVMCEKPLAIRQEDVEIIRALTEKHKTPLVSGYFQPFCADMQKIKKMICEGKLGTVTHASFRNGHDAAYGGWFDHPNKAWFADPNMAGGGALLDLGTHALHLLLHLCGSVESVWAFTTNCSGKYTNVDDYGLMLLRFTNGIIGRVEGSWVQNGGSSGLEIIGSKACVWQKEQSLVYGTLKDSATEINANADLERPDRVSRLIAVIEDKIPETELQEDLTACLDAVTVMDAAYRSAQTGKWETVSTLK